MGPDNRLRIFLADVARGANYYKSIDPFTRLYNAVYILLEFAENARTWRDKIWLTQKMHSRHATGPFLAPRLNRTARLHPRYFFFLRTNSYILRR